jgi:TPR repeat protein
MKKNRIFLGLMVIAMIGCFHSSLADDNTTTSEEVTALRTAAEAGDSDAQFQLGDAYQKGEGIRQDDTQAAKWFERSANQGNSDGQFAIGFAYRGGFGVPEDKVLAYMWFELAAQQGNEEAPDLRTAVAELMTYDQISEARKKARNWKPKPEEKPADSSR